MPPSNGAISKSIDFNLIDNDSKTTEQSCSSMPPRSATTTAGVIVRKRSWRTHYVRPQKSFDDTIDTNTYHHSCNVCCLIN